MMWFMRRDLLMEIYPDGIAEFQALMPPGPDGTPIQFGLLSDLLATTMLDPQGQQWVFLEDSRLTRVSLDPVFDRALELGFTEPECMFVSSGFPEGFYFPEDD